MLIYFDSNIVIYLIEQNPIFGRKAAARFNTILAVGDKIVVSDLTRVECRSKPLAASDSVLLSAFDFFFARSAHRIEQLTTAVCDRATAIRGGYGIKTADALHLAAAVEAGCSTFLTNDTRLNRFTGLTVEVLS